MYADDFSKWLSKNNIRLKVNYNSFEKCFYVIAIHNNHQIKTASSNLEEAIDSIASSIREHLKICVS